MMRFASALLLALACWAGAAETRIALKTSHNLYSKVVACWPFATATAEPVDAADALVASPISTAFDGVAGALPARVADDRGTLGFVPAFGGLEYFKCGALANYERTQAFSSFFIAKSASDAGVGYIYAKQNATVRGYSLQLSAKTLTVRIANSSTNLVRLDYANALLANVWTTICVTYDGSSTAAGVKLYLNGVLTVGTVINNNLSATIITTEEFAIGARTPSTAAIFFPGSIAYGAIFNDDLTAAEVAQISMNHLDLLELNRTSKTKYVRYLINNGVFRAR